MTIRLVAALAATLFLGAALPACKTSGQRSSAYSSAEPAAIDGVPYRNPGAVQRTRNAFNTFRY